MLRIIRREDLDTLLLQSCRNQIQRLPVVIDRENGNRSFCLRMPDPVAFRIVRTTLPRRHQGCKDAAQKGNRNEGGSCQPYSRGRARTVSILIADPRFCGMGGFLSADDRGPSHW